ncbi:MAG: hypothetical protein AAB459_01640, partial [Patescibacteria group bacterium]
MWGVIINGLVGSAMLLFASNPTSTNFTLKAYDFGGGGDSTGSTNFNLNSTVGTQNGSDATSTNFTLKSGQKTTQEAKVTSAPTFTNPSSEYRRLRIVINTNGNTSDTLYAVAISPDGFVSTTNFVKADSTIGTTLILADYRTYASWGGASGVWVNDLSANTTYTVKVRAFQGDFSETPYSPTANAATVLPTLTFSVTTSLTGTPPFAANFSSLVAGSVVSADADALIGLTTNALLGGAVYIKGLNTGLLSASESYTIASATADLTAAESGYGAQVVSVTQSSGGPFSSLSPYDGSSNNVGVLSANFDDILNTPAAVTTGDATIRFKAKSSGDSLAASDYTDTISLVAAMSF